MLSRIIYLAVLVYVVGAEKIAGAIERDLPEMVNSLGYKLVYGDEDMTVLNQVITDMEKKHEKNKMTQWKTNLKPLDREDVKCLMSVDRYCSKDMREMKRVLIDAVSKDCANCTQEEKDKAGKVVASMLAFDSFAWKTFLTRLALQIKSSTKKEKPPITDETRYELLGEPEEVPYSKRRHTAPGFKVRVKRFVAKKLP